jgi:hypothetical protein
MGREVWGLMGQVTFRIHEERTCMKDDRKNPRGIGGVKLNTFFLGFVFF